MSDPGTDENEPDASSQQARSGPQMGCPMSSMCSAMFGKAPSRLLLMLPGAALILLGVAILIRPQVLVWLVAGVAVLLGAAMLLMANLMVRRSAKARPVGG